MTSSHTIKSAYFDGSSPANLPQQFGAFSNESREPQTVEDANRHKVDDKEDVECFHGNPTLTGRCCAAHLREKGYTEAIAERIVHHYRKRAIYAPSTKCIIGTRLPRTISTRTHASYGSIDGRPYHLGHMVKLAQMEDLYELAQIGATIHDDKKRSSESHSRMDGMMPTPTPYRILPHLPRNAVDLSHLCHNVRCLNPDHLVWEDSRVNSSRNACLRRRFCSGHVAPVTRSVLPKCIFHTETDMYLVRRGDKLAPEPNHALTDEVIGSIPPQDIGDYPKDERDFIARLKFQIQQELSWDGEMPAEWLAFYAEPRRRGQIRRAQEMITAVDAQAGDIPRALSSMKEAQMGWRWYCESRDEISEARFESYALHKLAHRVLQVCGFDTFFTPNAVRALEKRAVDVCSENGAYTGILSRVLILAKCYQRELGKRQSRSKWENDEEEESEEEAFDLDTRFCPKSSSSSSPPPSSHLFSRRFLAECSQKMNEPWGPCSPKRAMSRLVSLFNHTVTPIYGCKLSRVPSKCRDLEAMFRIQRPYYVTRSYRCLEHNFAPRCKPEKRCKEVA